MEALRINDYATCKLDDKVVVSRILAGEKALFEILLRRYNQRLYRVVRSYLKDEDEVRDAMQNTYLNAFDKLFQFHGDAAFSTWLIRIGINEALLRLKQMKKHREVSFTPIGPDEQKAAQIPDRNNPEKIIIRGEAQALLETAIDNLPEKYRIVYILKEVEGLPSSEVIDALGLSDANVKVRLHRAKALLKESLYKLSVTSGVFEFGNSRCDALVSDVMMAI
jgi:RNA polymerase sigma factor (sigma-70 family)